MSDGSVQRGSTVVVVRVPIKQHDRVAALLVKHDSIDLDERAAAYAPALPATSGVPADGWIIRLAKESLTVGKRTVAGGTTRIRRYVVATPVEKRVTLRQEKVAVERRPVSSGEAAGRAAFNEKTIEMTAASEEAGRPRRRSAWPAPAERHGPGQPAGAQGQLHQ